MQQTLEETGKVTTNISQEGRHNLASLVDSITDCMGWRATPACVARAIIEGVLGSTALKGLHTVKSEDDLSERVALWMSKGYKPLRKPKPKKLKRVAKRQIDLFRKGDAND